MLSRASTDGVREQNRKLVLSALRRRGALAHTDISVETALSSATVTTITQDLESEGAIERTPVPAASGRGRPKVLFRPRAAAAHVVIGKISADLVQLSLVNYSGTLIDRIEERRPLPTAGTEAFLEILRGGLARLAGRSNLAASQVAAISLSSKGLVSAERPVMLWSPIFGDRRIDFAAALSEYGNARILLSNETLLVAGALYRALGGAATGLRRPMATLSMGHSIGLGIVLPEPVGEPRLRAPNFGHMPHVPGGAMCRCGARGCVEAYAGFYAILRTAFDVPETTIPAKFVPLAEIEKIAATARAGNRRAQFAFRQAGTALGSGLARLMSLFEPMPVIVTGPGAVHFDLMKEAVEDSLRQAFVSRLATEVSVSALPDEEHLIFAGNVQLTLDDLDQNVIAARGSAAMGKPAS